MLEYFLASITGYSIGRVGHIVGGSVWWIPHHWIFGVVIIIFAIFLKKFFSKNISLSIKVVIILFALGIILSDFKDFLDLKTFEPEDVKVVQFWGVD